MRRSRARLTLTNSTRRLRIRWYAVERDFCFDLALVFHGFFCAPSRIRLTFVFQIPAILLSCATHGILHPILVMDNCRVHHNVWVKALLLSHGIAVEFLAPYTPTSNPIEEAFSKFKAWIRRHAASMRDLGYSARATIDAAFASITTSDALGWVIHAGY